MRKNKQRHTVTRKTRLDNSPHYIKKLLFQMDLTLPAEEGKNFGPCIVAHDEVLRPRRGVDRNPVDGFSHVPGVHALSLVELDQLPPHCVRQLRTACVKVDASNLVCKNHLGVWCSTWFRVNRILDLCKPSSAC